MEIAQEARERIARQAEAQAERGSDIASEAAARRAEIAEIDPSFVADPGASFQENFINALGLKTASKLGGFLDRIGVRDATNIANEDDLREELQNVSPEAMLDAVAAADPSQQPVIDLIKADPELSEALHQAIVKDPTMLTGLQEMLGEEGSSADLQAILQNDMQRGVLTEVLQNIANDPGGTEINFSHLRAIMEAESLPDKIAAVRSAGAGASLNPLAGIDSLQEIVTLLNNPDNFIRNFMSDMDGMSPFAQNVMAGMMSVFSKAMGGFFDPNGNFAGSFVKGFGNVGTGFAQIGQDVLNFEAPTGTQTTTSNLPRGGNMSQEQQQAASSQPANMNPANSPNEPASNQYAQVTPPSQMAGGMSGPT
ncbi:MAG: hypothetical protein AAF244_02175 [Pseudomonadota bacterium]